MARAATPPLRVHSVAFAFGNGSEAIPLRDVATDGLIGARPEWQNGQPPRPAAYLRGARPVVRVVLGAPAGTKPGATVKGLIAARGTGGPGVMPHDVTVRFDSAGLSAPLDLRCDGPLPDRIGAWRVTWNWQFGVAGSARPRAIGTTRHEILTTWRRTLDARAWLPPGPTQTQPTPPPPGDWTYEPIARWTCQWAAGAADPKTICDRIMTGLVKSGLKYFVSAHDVRDVLQKGGGMCGGWYKTFQALAGAQGVEVQRRSFLVDWRDRGRNEVFWNAIVVTAGGLGHKRPPVEAETYHDVDAAPLRRAPVKTRTRQKRYWFFGAPGTIVNGRRMPGHADGHCINFLEHDGATWLYDASFGIGGVRLKRFTVPPIDLMHARNVRGLGSWRTGYLDDAVAYMMGSVKRRGGLFQTREPGIGEPADDPAVVPGLTVRTAVVNASDVGITFYWGP